MTEQADRASHLRRCVNERAARYWRWRATLKHLPIMERLREILLRYHYGISLPDLAQLMRLPRDRMRENVADWLADGSIEAFDIAVERTDGQPTERVTLYRSPQKHRPASIN